MMASAAVQAAMGGGQPTARQWAAISHPPEPLAIIAGAGSGKTAVMAARMVWMVEQGLVRPAQILGLTFTNKAATELEERILLAFARLDPPPAEVPTVATYNSFADRIVRQEGARVGVDPESSLLSQAQAWQLVKESLNDVQPFDAIDSRSIESITKNALALADQCANNCVTPEQVAREDLRILQRGESAYERQVLLTSLKRSELTGVVRAYQDVKARRRAMDFGDQVTKAVEILQAWESVAADLRQRYPAILLDEYQDTNVAQRRMLQAIAPHGSNVTAVGDARQNIFQWRGSTLFNLLDFPKEHFLRTGGKPHRYLSLADNFRSASRVVQVANAIIDKVPAQRRPGLPLHSVEGNGQGQVATALLSDQRAEAEFIATRILELHGRPAGEGRPATRWKDFAVLVRRKAHMPLIYSVLSDHEIPVEVAGLSGLLQVPEVMDTVAWLRVVADPGPASNRWLARILLGPRYRIHYRDLAVLARWAGGRTRQLSESKRTAHPAGPQVTVQDETDFEPDDVAFSLVEALEHLDEVPQLASDAGARLARMRSELMHMRRLAGAPLLDLVREIVSSAGIGDALAASPRRDAAAAQGNLRQFMGLVAGFSPLSAEPSLTEFVEYLDAAEEAEDSMEQQVTPAEDSVKLTTVHGAKGLEFEVVFVPGVAAFENQKGQRVYSMFPDERASNPMLSYSLLPYGVREDARHLPDPRTTDSEGNRMLKSKTDFARELKERAVEDERRLFYVALTRARQRLYVTAAWWYERQSRAHGPSIFFDEVAGLEMVDNLVRHEFAEQSPLLAELQERAIWPPVVRNLYQSTPAMPHGPVEALEDLLSGAGSADQLLAVLEPRQREEAERLLEGYRTNIAALDKAAAPLKARAGEPAGITASEAVDLVAGRLTEARIRRPLPRRPEARARLGVQVHRWIESRAHLLAGLAGEDDLEAAGVSVDAALLARLKRTWEDQYGSRTLARLPGGEPMAELAFVLKVGGRLLRGRMDAVYVDEAQNLEIVDFKTGELAEPPEIDQLIIYAAALHKLNIPLGDTLKLTYAYLSTGESSTRQVRGGEVQQALAGLAQRIGAVPG